MPRSCRSEAHIIPPVVRFSVAAIVAVSLIGVFHANAQDVAPPPDDAIDQFGTPPAIPQGPVSEDTEDAVSLLVAGIFDQADWGTAERDALERVTRTADPRLVWVLIDMMRFTWSAAPNDALAQAGATLLGIEFDTVFRGDALTDHLIAWDVPAYPGYSLHKRALFANFLPAIAPLITPRDKMEWHLVGWGGVGIDARAFGRSDEPCACIPAIDNPQVSAATEADWLQDDDTVFGIVVNGEARAYPRRIMEVREMVNDTLGGRDLGIPYCTLCGAAQAYITDNVAGGFERPVFRTSGLLIRSNKVMYDVTTGSVFDTFRGRAVTGPMAEANVILDPVTVITTDWGAWRLAHPDTTVLVEALALGRDYDLRNTRDARGPIFPVGDVDPRLPVQEDVIGVISPDGGPIAFQRSKAMAALISGQTVGTSDVRLVREAGGLRAVGPEGDDLGSHQAFWFAWSQFHPTTRLWPE